MVEAIRIDLDDALLGCTPLLRFLGCAGRGSRGWRRRELGGSGRRRGRSEHGLHIAFSQRSSLYQQRRDALGGCGLLAQHRRELRGACAWRQNLEGYLVAHQREGRLDLRRRAGGPQAQLEAEVERGRVERVARRELIGARADIREFAERAQMIDVRARASAIAQGALGKTQREVKQPRLARLLRLLGSARARSCSRRLHALVALEPFEQLRAQRRIRIFILVERLDRVDQLGDVVLGIQQHRHEFAVDAELAIAHEVEHVLEPLRKAFDQLQLEQPGRAFDGVGRTKHRIDALAGLALGLDLEQRGFHAREQFAGFFDERHASGREVHTYSQITASGPPSSSLSPSSFTRSSRHAP